MPAADGSTQAGGFDAGTLTVSVRIGEPRTARYAAPSAAQQNFVYAALIYPDGASPATPAADEFAMGTLDESAGGSTINFMFQKPVQTSGLTVEVFAFKENTEEADFARANALLSGSKNGLSVNANNTITIDEIKLTSNASASAPKGTVSLKITVPIGCALEIDDTTNFALTGTSPDFTIEHASDGISAGSYDVAFKVTKNSETLHAFADTITVWPGMCTDTWGGLAAGEALEITAQKISKMFYVRGSGGWYDGSSYAATATASDDNSGSFLAPFATIQKAIDTVLAANDGSDYTIFVDGTLTYDGSNTYGMANFSAQDAKSLTLTIKPLLADAKSTLNANGFSRVIYTPLPSSSNSKTNLDLTLERLVLTGGMTTSASGGGIYIAGSASTTRKITAINCDIIGNEASAGGGVCVTNYGAFTMTGGTVSNNIDNSTSGGGGGIYASDNLLMSDVTISNNISKYCGGGIRISGEGTATNCDIIENEASQGGGVYIANPVNSPGKLTMVGGTISGNIQNDKNGSGGGGINADGILLMSDMKISKNTSKYNGGGIFVTGTVTATNCDIIENETAYNGGGVYVNNGKFEMIGGTISDNTTNLSRYGGGGVYVYNGGTLSMSEDATISKNSAKSGKGAYLFPSSSAVPTLSMSGAAYFDPDDDVYLGVSGSSIPTIQVDDPLTQNKVATITPSSYAKGTQVLSAGSGVTMTQDICDQFALTSNPDNTEWVIALDSANNAGMLKRAEISGGIEIVIPGLETYTFTVNVGGSALSEGTALTVGQTVTLSNVVDSKGRTPSGTLKVAIQESSGTEFPGATATGDVSSLPLSVAVPVVPPVGAMPAQVYLELTLDGAVINKTIDVTISN